MIEVEAFDHVGVLTEDLGTIEEVFGDLLGCELDGPHLEPHLGVEIVWVRLGEVLLECMAPVDEDSRAAARIRNGEVGVHHVAARVENIDTALSAARASGLKTMSEEPQKGARGSRIGFIDSASIAGTILELVERPAE